MLGRVGSVEKRQQFRRTVSQGDGKGFIIAGKLLAVGLIMLLNLVASLNICRRRQCGSRRAG
jgi:hypothetical protein